MFLVSVSPFLLELSLLGQVGGEIFPFCFSVFLLLTASFSLGWSGNSSSGHLCSHQSRCSSADTFIYCFLFELNLYSRKLKYRIQLFQIVCGFFSGDPLWIPGDLATSVIDSILTSSGCRLMGYMICCFLLFPFLLAHLWWWTGQTRKSYYSNAEKILNKCNKFLLFLFFAKWNYILVV